MSGWIVDPTPEEHTLKTDIIARIDLDLYSDSLSL